MGIYDARAERSCVGTYFGAGFPASKLSWSVVNRELKLTPHNFVGILADISVGCALETTFKRLNHDRISRISFCALFTLDA